MYLPMGTTSKGLQKWRSIRGSSKNETANLVAERSLHTTGRMKERLAMAALGERFTRYNLDIERALDGTVPSTSSSKGRVAGFKHCHDLLQVRFACC